VATEVEKRVEKSHQFTGSNPYSGEIRKRKRRQRTGHLSKLALII
jgi:hypothetical protein